MLFVLIAVNIFLIREDVWFVVNEIDEMKWGCEIDNGRAMPKWRNNFFLSMYSSNENCYECENCFQCDDSYKLKNCKGLVNSVKCKNCIDCVSSYRLKNCALCINCIQCFKCDDCNNCFNCVCCSILTGKREHIFNMNI